MSPADDLVGLGAAQAVEDVQLLDRGLDALAVVLQQRDALALLILPANTLPTPMRPT